MPTRLKYPEAASKARYYENVVRNLNTNYSEIHSYISNARTVPTSDLAPQNVDGKYYDYYIAKRDCWINIHRQQIASFDSFLTDLTVCINNANNLESLWNSRIGIMEEY